MAASTPTGSFPSPYEVETPPGCEGWEEMYPYYALFDERRREQDEQRFWFWNSMHFPLPMPAFDLVCVGRPVHGHRHVAEPRVRRAAGHGHRLPGRQRLHLHLREPGHRPGQDRRARRVLPEAGGLLLRELGRALREVEEEDGGADRGRHRPPGPGSARVRARGGRVRGRPQHARMSRCSTRTAGYCATASSCGSTTASSCCSGTAPMRRSSTSARTRCPTSPTSTSRRWSRASTCSCSGPTPSSSGSPVSPSTPASTRRSSRDARREEIDDELAQSDAGKAWLEELEKVKDPWFNMATGDGLYHYYGSWLDDPSIPYASLIGYVRALTDGEEIERPTEELARERDRLAEEYGALLDEETRKGFDELLGLSRMVFPYVEEHKFLCDYWFLTHVVEQGARVRGAAREARIPRGRRGRLPALPHGGPVGARRARPGVGHGRRAARARSTGRRSPRAARRSSSGSRTGLRHRPSGPCPRRSTTRC